MRGLEFFRPPFSKKVLKRAGEENALARLKIFPPGLGRPDLSAGDMGLLVGKRAVLNEYANKEISRIIF